ncbi:HTH-type transcriptional regulator HdfR [Castellaniella caeni]
MVTPTFLLGARMTRQMPSLNGLRAFEATGRHGSFKAAAEELNVTQTAVSHMVRLLEEALGFALFRRHANRLELTDQGRAFQPGLTDAFDAIARLSEQVVAMQAGSVLTVGVAPTLALHWLIPRLTSFNRNHPDVEVRVATGGAMLPLRDDWTCTVRRGMGSWPGYTAEELFPFDTRSSLHARNSGKPASSTRSPRGNSDRRLPLARTMDLVVRSDRSERADTAG